MRLKPAAAVALARRTRPGDSAGAIEPSVSTNAITKLSAEIVGRLATFGLYVVAARELGPTEFGRYSYALAIGYVLAQLADLGLQTLITREVAILGSDARPLVRTALALKLGLAAVAGALVVAVAADKSGGFRTAIICLSAALILQTFAEFCAYVFRGQQNLRREAVLLTGLRLCVAGAGILVLWLGAELVGLAVTTAVATAGGAAVGLVAIKRRGWLAQRPDDPRRAAAMLLRAALPLGIAAFLSIGFTRIALFLLDRHAGPDAVAQFSAAQRVVEPTQVLPFAVLAAVFPAFSLAQRTDRHRARRLGTATTVWLAAAGVLVAAVLWIAAPWVARLYGTGFGGSVDVLRVLAWSVVPAYVNYALTYILIARDQQALTTLFMAAVLVVHGTLAWVLIPQHGAVGPAISYVVAEVVLTACCVATLALTRART